MASDKRQNLAMFCYVDGQVEELFKVCQAAPLQEVAKVNLCHCALSISVAWFLDVVLNPPDLQHD